MLVSQVSDTFDLVVYSMAFGGHSVHLFKKKRLKFNSKWEMKNSLDFYRQSKGPTQDRQEEFGPI